MLSAQAAISPEDNTWRDAAITVLIMVMAAAVLFPETFITSFPLIGKELTFPLTLLLPFLTIAAAYAVYNERSRLGFYAVDALVIVFFAYLLARNLSAEPLAVSKFVVIGVGVYYLTAALTLFERGRRQTFMSITVLMLLTCLYGLLEFALQENVLLQPHISVGQPGYIIHRMSSFLAHPVVYGAFLVQAIPFSAYLTVKGWSKWVRAVSAVATVLAVICMILTSSKGSWIAAILVGAFVVAYYARTRGRKGVFILLAVILLAGAAVAVYANRSSLDDILRPRTSVDVRITAWEAALEGIAENPAFGVGHKEGQDEVIEQIPDWWKELSGFQPPADNYYLNIFLEEGMVGGILWVLMMSLILIGGFQVVRRSGEERFMRDAALLSIVALMINMVTFDAFLIPPNHILFWVAAGILRAGYMNGEMQGRVS